ncbi:hypothetical protein, partial [Dickeya dadantii]|uniref:hypothetical protein n=1 Tax=Dickeya dadantii TaxID=204038 RepID=UPI001C375D46
GEVAFEPLLVVRAMKQQRNYTAYTARNYSLTGQTSPFTRQHSCLPTASSRPKAAACAIFFAIETDNQL